MKRVLVSLEAQSPIAVGEWMSSRSNVRESMSYIPGGALRGALAQAVLEQLGMHRSSRRTLGAGDPTLQQAFETCFSKDGARFGFLMPFASQDWVPAPTTALFNKQREQFLYDTLFALLRGEKYEMECPRNEGERLERGRGWLIPAEGGWRRATLPAPRAFVRVGLNRKLEAAQEGVLYTLEAIDPTDAQGAPVVFQGAVAFPDDACEEAFHTILGALRWRDGAVRLRIGSARTRGFGEVVLKLADESPPETQADLDAFAKRAGKPVFTLLARTPVLVHDARGAPAQTLSPELLREYLPELPDSVRPLPEATRIERVQVSGWSGAWGMPKPVQQAFAPGSVFTYEYAQNDRDALQAWLQQLNTHGIGERVAEGYGQLVACSRYHLDNDITQYSGGAQ